MCKPNAPEQDFREYPWDQEGLEYELVEAINEYSGFSIIQKAYAKFLVTEWAESTSSEQYEKVAAAAMKRLMKWQKEWAPEK